MATTTENGKAKKKTYTLRDIPPDLHKRWKVFASIREVTMEEILYDALKQYIDEGLAQRESQHE